MELKDYKYVVAGAGFFGSVLAERIANDLQKPVPLIEKGNHTGGNCFSKMDEETGIEYHCFGTHIFHTSNELVWDYIQRFTAFNSYYHQVLTTYQNKVYQMPINLETINSFFHVNLKPYEVEGFLQAEIAQEKISNPRNFEEKAVSLIGRRLYEAFIKGYTKKQWQKDPRDIPAEVLARLPFRKNYNESYYFSRWQGIPLHGYAAIFNKMLENDKIKLLLNTDFFSVQHQLASDATVIYSGAIDRFFNYQFGRLQWRTTIFEKEVHAVEDYQGTSVMNYAEEEFPFTRIHEPRHLHTERDYTKSKTIILKEYSKHDDGTEPYYPVNDQWNQQLVVKYRELAAKTPNLFISGRLGEFKYYDMHETIALALKIYSEQIKKM